MQSDCRKPQLVTQVEIELRSRLLLQAAMQVFCSPLHRIGAAAAASIQSKLRRKRPATRESKRRFHVAIDTTLFIVLLSTIGHGPILR